MSSTPVKLQNIFVLLIFFCTSALSIGEVQLEQYPKTLERDDSIRTWTSVQQYDNITSEHLISEARKVLELSRKNSRKDYKPTAVSALKTGRDKNKVYFASSAKGIGDIVNDPHIEMDEELKTALEACGKSHTNHQRCGEIMAIASWHRHPENKGKKLSEVHSKQIVTVRKQGPMEPCKGTGGEHYGCENVLKHMGIESIGEECKRSIGGKAYNNKACAMKSGAKSATLGKQSSKKATATPRKQPLKKVTATPRKQPLKKVTATPQKQPLKKATATPRKQPLKKPTATPRKQPLKKPTTTLRKQSLKKATATPRKQPLKKPTVTPRKQPLKKPTTTPRKQPLKKLTTTPQKQPLKKATATPRKQPPKKATATPRKQPPKKPSAARKHGRSVY